MLLFNLNNEVLLLRRINTPFCNQCYSLPGGKIEIGETACQAAIREAQNSLEITIEKDDLTFKHVMSRKCNEPEFFACVFQVTQWDREIQNGEPERHDDVQWFALDKLPTAIVSAHKQAIEFVAQGISYSEHGW